MYRISRKCKGSAIQNTIDLREVAKISFVLYSEVEEFLLAHVPFFIEGDDITYEGETDEQGCFEVAPVEFEEYDLTIGKVVFRIPAVSLNAPPHPVHLSYDGTTDIFGVWDGPLDEELSEEEAFTGVDGEYLGLEE